MAEGPGPLQTPKAALAPRPSLREQARVLAAGVCSAGRGRRLIGLGLPLKGFLEMGRSLHLGVPFQRPPLEWFYTNRLSFLRLTGRCNGGGALFRVSGSFRCGRVQDHRRRRLAYAPV